MKPARGTLFCKPVKTAESLAGSSIVLLDDTRERWVGQQAEVVAVGPPGICEDVEDCSRWHFYGDGTEPKHNVGVLAGDWVLVEPRMFVEVAEGLWALPQDSVLAVLAP
jgi:hypothetical protein